jgi:quercetin dioxygenase-like cupin family protein
MIISVYPVYKFTYDNTELNIFHANKGEGLPKHEHIYSHATFCSSGSCVIRVENKEIIINKNTQPINLLASKWHEIEALEDNTVFINVFTIGKR